jgi:hypothetical protein
MAVKMIDSNFKSIVTGKKSILDLKHNDACKYKKWYNLYDIKSPVEDIRWIPEYRDIISDDINKSNSKESSKRMEFESLARILLGANISSLVSEVFLLIFIKLNAGSIMPG